MRAQREDWQIKKGPIVYFGPEHKLTMCRDATAAAGSRPVLTLVFSGFPASHISRFLDEGFLDIRRDLEQRFSKRTFVLLKGG